MRSLVNDHLDEIFSWIVDGAAEWYETRSLEPCEVMTAEMNKYVQELDVVSHAVCG